MATKRTPLRRAGKARITPDVLELWTRLNEIVAESGCDEWEPTGRRREYLDASRALHRALGLKPWEAGPLETYRERPLDYMEHNPIAADGWRKGWEWRQALEAATDRR